MFLYSLTVKVSKCENVRSFSWRKSSPDIEDIRFTDDVLGNGATEVVLHVLHLGVAVEHLDEVVVAVVGHLQLVVGEL